jgi:histidine ammonia-lyase
MELIELTGRALSPEQVARFAHGTARAAIAPDALARAAAAADTAERIAARQPVYGRTTGVGANRIQRVEDGDVDHGLRLLRSHASGIGPLVSSARVRAMLAVRANQLLAGGAGLRPGIIEAIVAALNANTLPEIHEFGSVGTADLTALAELGLALAGELPWITDIAAAAAEAASPEQHEQREQHEQHGGGRSSSPDLDLSPITAGDALALMSSSALTIGRACLGWLDASRCVQAVHAVSMLSFAALDGSSEPFAQTVHARRPHPGSTRSATLLRALLAGQRIKPARIQDPFALRCIPQVHGAALSALESVERVLDVEINVAAENPLVSVADDAVYHHGGFHQAQLTQSLDALNLALLSVGQLSLVRLQIMFVPEYTGLRPFLADGEAASSGVMITEMVGSDALSELRNAAMPAGLGHAALSHDVEDHSPFASQAARQTARAVDALRLVIASELVVAIRTLRLRGLSPVEGTVLRRLYDIADVLDTDTADRPPTPDIHLAAELLPHLAAVVAQASHQLEDR